MEIFPCSFHVRAGALAGDGRRPSRAHRASVRGEGRTAASERARSGKCSADATVASLSAPHLHGGACIHAGGSTMGFCDTYVLTQWRCVDEAITSMLVDLSNHSQISPPTWFPLKDIDTSNKAGKRTALTGARGALVSSLSRPWALWNGVSTDDVQKGKWITKLNHLQTQESGKLLFGQFLHRNFGLHLRQQAPCGSAGPLNATKQEGTARTHTARVIALTDTSESRRSERCESLRTPQRRRSFGGRLVPIIGLADFTSQIERNLYKIENRQTLPALVRYKCMTPFVLIQQGHCLSLYIRQKKEMDTW